MSNVERDDREPRWPVVLSTLGVAGLHYSLPNTFRAGPEWLVVVVCGLLLAGAVIANHQRNHKLNDQFGYLLVGAITLFTVFASGRLALALIHKEHVPPQRVLISAGLLWVSNVLNFAIWYWRIDAGGPNARDKRQRHETDAFLFPQTTLEDHQWNPQFMDYLFLSFNTSTALSPADTAALSRPAKGLMMLQASISLVIIILIAARAVNVL
jgi:uncharacterized membrane protein